jgi:hypothetical protein
LKKKGKGDGKRGGLVTSDIQSLKLLSGTSDVVTFIKSLEVCLWFHCYVCMFLCVCNLKIIGCDVFVCCIKNIFFFFPSQNQREKSVTELVNAFYNTAKLKNNEIEANIFNQVATSRHPLMANFYLSWELYLLGSLRSLIQNNKLLLARMFGESNTGPDGARKRILFMVEFQYVSNNIVKSPTKNEIRRFVVVLLLYTVVIIIIYYYYYYILLLLLLLLFLLFISMEYFFFNCN